jgi:hypothetical protein
MTMSNWSLLDHLTAGLEKPRFGDKKRPNFWPSEASAQVKNDHDEEVTVGKCRRAIYLRYLYDCYDFYPERYTHYAPLIERIRENYVHPDNYVRWLWIQGELYEEYCVRQATQTGVHIASQVPAFYISPGGWSLSGKIDEVVLNPETGKYSCVEYKSVYGFGGNFVLGSESERRRGLMGTPRESNLMQVGYYDWKVGKSDDRFENSRLPYGSRDTGRYAEYEISTEMREGDEETFIYYRGISPHITDWTNSGISMENILGQFQYVQNCLDSGEIPARDYEHTFSEEKMNVLWQRGELSKADAGRMERRAEQIEESKAKINKLPEKGDWQCRGKCSFCRVCYDEAGNPTEL